MELKLYAWIAMQKIGIYTVFWSPMHEHPDVINGLRINGNSIPLLLRPDKIKHNATEADITLAIRNVIEDIRQSCDTLESQLPN